MEKQRWVVMEGIPGIASKDEIVIVRPDWGILITRRLPLARYPDIISYRHLLSPLRPRRSPPRKNQRPRHLTVL